MTCQEPGSARCRHSARKSFVAIVAETFEPGHHVKTTSKTRNIETLREFRYPNVGPDSLDLVAVTLCLALGLSLFCCGQPSALAGEPPPAQREFRGVWVATVANIDWPSQPGLPVSQQQTELINIVDRARELNLNAIVFQVRPAADAIYVSKLEPWSPYLTGTMGTAPDPFYDPLEFAIHEAHRRGLELHAWFNPYRALHKTFKGDVADGHIRNRMPNGVKEYDGYLWLDPGNPAAARHSLDVIVDVVRRYDIDGVHLDDYFYPYPIVDDNNKEVPFPDSDSFAAAKTEMNLSDWRRANVDQFIHQLYGEVKAARREVKVGISPFGIWRPGHPESIVGFDAYEKLYADARKWLRNGWVDYLTPQLYWQIESPGQSYPKLLNWWIAENDMGRLIWPGNYASKVRSADSGTWPAEEIINQIEVTRQTHGASGNVLFSMKSLFDKHGPLGDALLNGPYRQPALVPASPWLGDEVPGRPTLSQIEDGELRRVCWELPNDATPWLWVVRKKTAGKWTVQILPSHETSRLEGQLEDVVVSAVNRTGQEGPAAALSDGVTR